MMHDKSETILIKKDQQKGLSAIIEQHLKIYFEAHEGEKPASGLYGRILQEVEKPLLQIALGACQGNQLKTAELLGLNRNTLRKKIKELGLSTGRHYQRSRVRKSEEGR